MILASVDLSIHRKSIASSLDDVLIIKLSIKQNILCSKLLKCEVLLLSSDCIGIFGVLDIRRTKQVIQRCHLQVLETVTFFTINKASLLDYLSSQQRVWQDLLAVFVYMCVFVFLHM